MLTTVLNFILRTYANKYFIGPIIFTLAFVIILFSSYNSSNHFDLVATFFGYTTIVSALLLSVFLNNIFNDKKNFADLFTMAFVSLIMSIMTVLFFKTHSFLSNFAIVTSIIATFIFFTIFKGIINKMHA